ncbi:D-alanine--poly(phosphoribitol) ligase subunit DltC [Lactobacillus selangorensis]|nr:D-alanine--poly(phosphoribitol) ligase subunit DltC [Lactobacillus selangorensis]
MADNDNVQSTVMSILTDLTGSDEVTKNPDIDLFTTGMLDSMATVQLLLELQSQLGINVPVSEFDRTQWNTPNKIIAKVESMQG